MHPALCITTAMAVALVGANAIAQCPEENFDAFAVDTLITNQVSGVTFLAIDFFGDPAPAVSPIVATHPSGTNSPPHALTLTQSPSEFSPEDLRMVFDELQRKVTFRVGCYGGDDIDIRWYDDAGVLLGTQVFHGLTPSAYSSVEVGSEGGQRVIRRVEVDSPISDFELIDDLKWGFDPTPPEAEITVPTPLQCVCNPAPVRGISCDPDGLFDNDTLEYRQVGESAWTLYDSFNSPLCTEGQLYLWDTTALVDGYYELRLTTTNKCGLVSTDLVTVRVDKAFTLDEADIREPDNGDVLAGTACIDGTAWDYCFASYDVEYRPLGAPTFTPLIISGSSVITDPLLLWDTTTVPDGAYELAITGTTTCTNSSSVSRLVEVDNTPPISFVSSIASCDSVSGGLVDIFGTAADAHFERYTLAFTGGPFSSWQSIISSNIQVVNGPLAQWNVSALPPCAYTLRLRVWDKAVLDCDEPHHSDYYVSLLVNTCNADANKDGVVDVNDLAFVIFRFGPCS